MYVQAQKTCSNSKECWMWWVETQRYSDNADLEHEADNDIICDSVNDKENESFNKTFVNPSQEMTSEND